MFEKAEILIVDDMPEHIAFAGTILRNEGFGVLGATSANAALKMTEKSKPHLILLDIKMEGMDGLELCFDSYCTHFIGMVVKSELILPSEPW